MIIDYLFNGLLIMIDGILSILDILPDMPGEIVDTLDQFFDLIFNAMPLVSIIIDINYISIVFPIFLAILNFDKIYKLLMWVLRKIPMLGIE